jgi:hypothetical protein
MPGARIRKLLVLICVLGIPCAAWPQSKPTSWENLNTLQCNEKIQVVEINANKISGLFSNVSDAAISLQAEGRQQTIQRPDVRSVKLMKYPHRLRNTIIGAAVGAGVGAGIGTVGHHQGSLQNPNGTLIKPAQGAEIGAVIGLVGGAVIGALVTSHKTIYQVKSQ